VSRHVLESTICEAECVQSLFSCANSERSVDKTLDSAIKTSRKLITVDDRYLSRLTSEREVWECFIPKRGTITLGGSLNCEFVEIRDC